MSQALQQKSKPHCRNFIATQSFQTSYQSLHNVSTFFISHFNQLRSSTSKPHFLELPYYELTPFAITDKPGTQMANWGAHVTHQSRPDLQALPASFSPYLLQGMAGIPCPLPSTPQLYLPSLVYLFQQSTKDCKGLQTALGASERIPTSRSLSILAGSKTASPGWVGGAASQTAPMQPELPWPQMVPGEPGQ